MKSSRALVSVPPKYLSGLYQGHIALQADKLVAPYLGEWMRLTGTIDDVRGLSTLIVTLREYMGMPIVLCLFEDTWREQLMRLIKEQAVTLEGRISVVGSTMVQLDSCELIE